VDTGYSNNYMNEIIQKEQLLVVKEIKQKLLEAELDGQIVPENVYEIIKQVEDLYTPLEKYDDGQGRGYDILDEELN
jgi:hypothetical protein